MIDARPTFVDTSAWIEALNPHAPANETFREALLAEERLVTSNFVFDELLTHFVRRVGLEAASALGVLLLDGDVDFIRVTPRDELEAFSEFVSQPAPKPREGVSFTDCTCFALMRRLGLTRVLAKDPHFVAAGFEVLPAPPGVEERTASAR